jgi:hypothetical protein
MNMNNKPTFRTFRMSNTPFFCILLDALLFVRDEIDTLDNTATQITLNLDNNKITWQIALKQYEENIIRPLSVLDKDLSDQIVILQLEMSLKEKVLIGDEFERKSPN